MAPFAHLSSSTVGPSGPALAQENTTQSFPNVPPDEAASLIRADFGESITVEDIAKPTPAVVLSIFQNFLHSLSGITEDDIVSYCDEMLRKLDYPELYKESNYLQLVFRETRALMLHARVEDFVWSDMIRPKPMRFKRQLSALINFYRFRMDRLLDFEDVTTEGTQLIQDRDKLVREVEKLSLQVDRETECRKDEQPQVAELQTENIRLQEELLVLKKEQGDLLQEHDVLRIDKADLSKLYESLNLQLQLASVEVRKLYSRVVQSPELLLASVATQTKQLEEDRQSLAGLEARISSLHARDRLLIELKKDMEDCLQILAAVAAGLEKHESEEDALKAIKVDMDESSRAYSEHEQKLAQVERALKSAETRLERLDSLVNKRRAEAERRVELHQEQIAQLKAEKEEMMRIEERKKAEANAVEQEYLELVRAFDAYVCNARHEHSRLEQRTNQYMDLLTTRLRLRS